MWVHWAEGRVAEREAYKMGLCAGRPMFPPQPMPGERISNAQLPLCWDETRSIATDE